MVISPYKTLVCQSYDVDPIERALKLAKLEGTLAMIPTKGTPLWLVKPENREVPVFGHPVILEDRIIIDGRGLVRTNREAENGFTVAQQAEFDFQVNRAKLQWYAHAQNTDDLAVLGDIVPTTFGRFIAENIVRALGLGPEEQARATLVLVFYYLCQFREPGEIDESEMNRLITKVSRLTFLSAEWIMERAAPLRYMGGIPQLIEVLHEMIDSPRIKQLNAGSLIAYVRGGWFGMNAVEMMGVALEHPPTYIAMVVASLKDRSYRNARLAKVIQQNDKKNTGRQFLLNTAHLGV